MLCVAHHEPGSILNLLLQQSHKTSTAVYPHFSYMEAQTQRDYRTCPRVFQGHADDKWQSEALDSELSDSRTSAFISLIPTILFS